MPFTFSHPAIVLPLKKINSGWFSMNGLVVGSLVPDSLYFLKMDGNADFGHSLEGVFLYDLPGSFLIAITFHLWVRNLFIMHLPSPLDKKYVKYLSFDFLHFLRRKWLSFTISALIGVLSHIFWDRLFTPEGWIYHQAPSVLGQTFRIAKTEIPLYIIIERIESLLGLIFVAWVVFKQKQPFFIIETGVSSQSKIYYWGSLLVSTLLISGFKIGADLVVVGLGNIIVITISACLLAFIVTTILFKVFFITPFK